MNREEKRNRLASIVERMKERYPDAVCALEYEGDPWRLLVMGRLSAQCTDARVNIVCKDLFAKYPNAEAMASGNLAEIEEIVKPCGLYHVKAENILDASRLLVETYHGALPDTMEELLTFPGVGRKIANLLLGDVFGKPAVVCDTHCIRICGRLGMYPEKEKDPAKIEKILTALIAPEEGSDFCHRIVWFGREVCTARAPKCEGCPLADLCEKHRRESGGADISASERKNKSAAPSHAAQNKIPSPLSAARESDILSAPRKTKDTTATPTPANKEKTPPSDGKRERR